MKVNIRNPLCLLFLFAAGMAVSAHTGDAVRQPLPPSQAVLEPDLARALAQAAPDATLRVIVVLPEQAAPEQIALSAATPAEARPRLVTALQAVAARTQTPLLAYLDAAWASRQVESYTPFWIFNGVAVRARPSAIRALAARPDVAAIYLDHWRRWVPTHPTNQLTNQPTNQLTTQPTPEWNISRIRAPQVWASLGISGTGAVVAGMDTGADWLHPALQANYRGYNPHGPANHTTSWYDATGVGALYPVDGHGHGTHTLGTAVGQDGIGVAPGAQWIAVRVLNNQGYGYDSWIHAGFQWLLAPGGDPSKAPDVVNCSWGNDNGWLTTFQPDLQALQAAGILAVFSNGNKGPDPGTVGSPASLPEAFAVGASDPYDGIAWFSSRGPSPWGEVRPHVVAPGVNVRSSLPGGAYDVWNGTSMAAPHVSGIALLLRSVSPTLSVTHTAFIITSTAAPLSTTLPNNESGWGLVDAFAAVAAVARPGYISGTVTWAATGMPVAGATVVATSRDDGSSTAAVTGADGVYRMALAPATYDLNVTAFGYEPAYAPGVVVTAGATTVRNFALTALPFGILQGHVTDAATGQPLTATVTVVGSESDSEPLREAVTHSFQFILPAGSYVLRARSLGHRVVTATVAITAGQYTVANLALPPAPAILLVDSGPWYYGSQIGYFRQALDDLAYAYDERSIRRLPSDVPTLSDLTSYDIVVWSAPEDAPGYIGAEGVITGYLSAGGRLLLSGQDIGFVDGGGGGLFWSAYYQDYLKARFVHDDAPVRVLEGLEGDIFAGLTITIAGPGGADNQDYPDVVAVADPGAAVPVLVYRDDGCGGMRVSTCLDYRVVYFAFGFEAINDRAARREVMDRALAWLVADPPIAGLELTPAIQNQIGTPGSAVTYTVRLRHVGQGGITDTISLTLGGGAWPHQLSTPVLALSPCTTATVVVTVTVPPDAPWDARDVVTLTARSSLSPTLAVTAVLTTKAPAPILLVDDDRWYEQDDKYAAALAASGFAYDIWSTHSANLQQGSPSLEILQRYPLVVWFTGYDWYAPVTPAEVTTLTTYLDGGGRLFLSAQDFLYYHHVEVQDPLPDFSRDYLGVLTYAEDVTPTLALGVSEDVIGNRLGPYPLNYPFRNWSDAVEPLLGVAVSFRDQARRGIALAHQAGDYRTVFFSFPFETLPEAARPQVMERVVGWLSWLGGSTFTVNRGTASGGDVLTYTVTLRNDGPTTVTASLSNTLPLSLTLVPGSLTGAATYEDPTRRVAWQGPLEPQAAVTFTYRVTVAEGLPAGAVIPNVARIGLEEQAIRFDREAGVRVGAPDLSPSVFGCAPYQAQSGSVVTCTLALINAGPADALMVTTVVSMPIGARVLAETTWTGTVNAGERITLSYPVRLPTTPVQQLLYGVAFLEDGTGGAWERPAWIVVEPFRWYLPLVFKNGR